MLFRSCGCVCQRVSRCKRGTDLQERNMHKHVVKLIQSLHRSLKENVPRNLFSDSDVWQGASGTSRDVPGVRLESMSGLKLCCGNFF